MIDWTVSASLTVGAELNDFFNWAEHFTNYHPEVMDTALIEVPKSYHPLRYQSKTYDECTNSLSVFKKDERVFLERYRWLRHVPEFVKPEDLFCVMNNAEAEKEAKQKSRYFELDSNSVRCPDPITLHSLIPYVKRLVRLFPQIKETVQDQLSSFHVRNRVYHYETHHCVSKIHNSPLDIYPGALDVTEFLTSDQQIWQLRMIDGDA